ncbi:MAG: trypsin-like peptidase domain-containing protein, partial [Hymenobacter sp.]|nr:trypsin-like peptidase domain-containing protein [Hymenobacter sp.]
SEPALAADPSVAAVGVAAPLAGLPDFSALVEREGAAVVNIAVAKKVAANTSPRGEVPPGADPFEFYRRFGPPTQPGPGGEAPVRQGTGSGFIVSTDGYILTNTHVVKDADEVTVTLTDRREFTARVIGTDDRTDVALIKIDASGLPAVHIGGGAEPGRGRKTVGRGQQPTQRLEATFFGRKHDARYDGPTGWLPNRAQALYSGSLLPMSNEE